MPSVQRAAVSLGGESVVSLAEAPLRSGSGGAAGRRRRRLRAWACDHATTMAASDIAMAAISLPSVGLPKLRRHLHCSATPPAPPVTVKRSRAAGGETPGLADGPPGLLMRAGARACARCTLGPRAWRITPCGALVRPAVPPGSVAGVGGACACMLSARSSVACLWMCNHQRAAPSSRCCSSRAVISTTGKVCVNVCSLALVPVFFSWPTPHRMRTLPPLCVRAYIVRPCVQSLID